VLIALDATARVAGSNGVKTVPVESIFKLPEANRRKQQVLDPGVLIEAFEVPATPNPANGVYLKVMERATWSFALVSAAVQIDWNGKQVQTARIVLGGVAGIPWRIPEAEKLLAGRKIDEASATQVSETAVSNAEPLQWNHYKVTMVRNLLKRAILELKPPALGRE
jgi:xanthine dehydrogenase YagS FAD-binding subunit